VGMGAISVPMQASSTH